MRLSLFLPPVIWALLISVGSSLSHPPAEPSAAWPSYGAHLLEFSVLAALVARAMQGRARSGSRLLAWSVALGASAVFGVADELHQALVPVRDADVVDWLVDVIGAAAGAALWLARSRPGRARLDDPNGRPATGETEVD